MKVLSLFDGISTGLLALERAGITVDVYYSSEIDKQANAISQYHYPNIIRLGDVNNIDFTQYKDVDLILSGSPCFVAGTLVMTNKGMKPIEEIQEGDMVLTHKSRYRKVLNVGCRLTTDLYTLQGYGFDEIITTKTHPFLRRQVWREWDNSRRGYNRVFTEPEWVECHHLRKGTQLASTYAQDSIYEESEYSEDFWYFVGRFVGDGWSIKSKRKGRENSYYYRNFLCCGKSEFEEVKAILDKLEYHYGVTEERTVYKFWIYNKKLYEFLVKCGHGAANKCVHPDLWNLGIKYKKAFLDGYLSADGYYNKCNHTISASSISRILIYELKQLCMEVYNCCPRIYCVKQPKSYIIENRQISQSDTYLIRFKKDRRKQDKAIFEKGKVWQPFYDYSIQYNYKVVYNIEVEEDNSYTANSIIVHNCQNLSVANRTRQGIHGENSNLFFKFIEALEVIRPKYFLQENVASMKNEDKRIITEEFLRLYPDTQVIQIDSALVSAQSRKRIYWTNIHTVQPKDKGIFLKDILENIEEGNWVTDSLKTDECIKVYDDFITALNGKRIDLQRLDEPYCLKEIRTEQGKALRRAARIEGKPDTTPRTAECKMFVPRTDRKANCLTTSCNHDAIVVIPYENYQFVRYLTPREWETLQTMPKDYTKYGIINDEVVEMSNSARYKALGNGWTCDVISHIFQGINSPVKRVTAKRLF